MRSQQHAPSVLTRTAFVSLALFSSLALYSTMYSLRRLLRPLRLCDTRLQGGSRCIRTWYKKCHHWSVLPFVTRFSGL